MSASFWFVAAVFWFIVAIMLGVAVLAMIKCRIIDTKYLLQVLDKTAAPSTNPTPPPPSPGESAGSASKQE